jgi:hypothetical protein
LELDALNHLWHLIVFPTLEKKPSCSIFFNALSTLDVIDCFFSPLLPIVSSLYESSFVMPLVVRVSLYITFSVNNSEEMSIHWVNPTCMVFYKRFRIKSGIIVVSAKAGITKSGRSSSAK